MNKHSMTIRLFTIALLALGATTHAQEIEPAALRQKLASVTGKGVQEKVFVHTDKTTYMAGEILWFKLYTVDALLHRPVNLSKVGYVDILDKANNPVAQVKVDLQGQGKGSIQLPLTLSTGTFKLRGYTAWMKNAGPDAFFEQVVTVINPLKNLDEEKAQVAPVPAYAVSFFPEGGALIQGLESRLAFKLTDKTGKGLDGTGVVVSANGDTITTFATHKFGIGAFSLHPTAGQSYKAIVSLPNGEQVTQALPLAEANGYTVQLSDEANGSIKVLVQSNRPEQERNLVYLLTHTRGVAKGTDRAVVSNGAALFYIDKAKLGEGVSQFTIFNKEGQPVCERLYFKRPVQGLTLAAQSDAAEYASRRKVSLTVQSKDKSGTATPADLSLAVYRLDSLQGIKGADIQSYLWLTSDLSGTIESPEYYLDATSPEVDKATDLLMLSHGWRRLSWKGAPAQRPSMNYPLEFNGHLVAARIIDSRTGTPAPNVPAFLSVPGLHYRFYTANSDSTGIVRFDVKDIYGASDLVLQANTPNENYYRFEMINPFATQYSAQQLPSFSLPASATVIEDHSIGMQVQNVYRGDSLRQFVAPLLLDTLPFYGKSDYTYALDEYVRFTTMEEVLREYVRQINVVLRGGKLYLRMFDEDRREYFEENVLVLVDGVALVDKNKIFEYDPRKVRKLDVIAKGYLLGPNYFKGVASFTTYAGNLEGFALDPRVLMVNYEGLQLEREFYAPVYETVAQQGSRIPDFRSTLYWKPDVTTDAKGGAAVSFYTSDSKGQYIGVLQGLDVQGRAASTTFTFSVN